MRFSNLIRVPDFIHFNGELIVPVTEMYINVHKVDSKYIVEFKDWGLDFYSHDFDELLSDLSFNIARVWSEFAEEDDVFLDKSGKRIKRNLLENFKKVTDV